MEDFFNKKSKEFDYSKEAVRQHRKLLRKIDRYERMAKSHGVTVKGKFYSPVNVKENIESNDRKTVLKLLLNTFKSTTRSQRKARWENTKYFLCHSDLDMSFSLLRKLYKVFVENKKRRENEEISK